MSAGDRIRLVADGPEIARLRRELDAARADAHRFREERDDLRGQLYRAREDLQDLRRERDEALGETLALRDRLSTIVDEAFGTQEVLGVDAMLSRLEHLLTERARQHEEVRRELDEWREWADYHSSWALIDTERPPDAELRARIGELCDVVTGEEWAKSNGERSKVLAERDEARAKIAEARAKLEEAKRAALVGWWSVCSANTWGFDSRIDHVAALLRYGRDALAVLEGRS